MTTSTTPSKRGKRYTPDSHDFPTRPYDLFKEMVIAGVILLLLTVALAAGFGSLDEKAITLQDWAKAAPFDVVATATGELAGTTSSAGYGPPYNNAADGQKLGPLSLQKWGGVRIPVDSAQDLVLTPLESGTPDAALKDALSTWKAAGADQQLPHTAIGDELAADHELCGDRSVAGGGERGAGWVGERSEPVFQWLGVAGGGCRQAHAGGVDEWAPLDRRAPHRPRHCAPCSCERDGASEVERDPERAGEVVGGAGREDRQRELRVAGGGERRAQ